MKDRVRPLPPKTQGRVPSLYMYNEIKSFFLGEKQKQKEEKRREKHRESGQERERKRGGKWRRNAKRGVLVV